MKNSGFNHFQLSTKVQAVQDAEAPTEVTALDRGYIDDVRKRIPKIEEALNELELFMSNGEEETTLKEPMLPYNVARALFFGIAREVDELKKAIEHYKASHRNDPYRPSIRKIKSDYEAVKECVEYYSTHCMISDEALQYRMNWLDKLFESIQKRGEVDNVR